jgi:ATP:ADP antiporter, AAA family
VQVSGAVLYILGRSAKFSLFKPAEEMVYLSLDERARTNGKAAVDVLGAQCGKSSGSLLQQALLLVTAGSAMLSLPVIAAVFLAIAASWGRSVETLARAVPQIADGERAGADSDGEDEGEEVEADVSRHGGLFDASLPLPAGVPESDKVPVGLA